MISSNSMRALVLTAAVFGCAVAAAQADECDTMTKTVEVMIDEMRAATGQLGALSLNQLKRLIIRHARAFDFGPQIGA
jgi:hypothetical protein